MNYGLKERMLDDGTILRSRIPVYPDVCPKCFFSFFSRNDLGPFKDLSEGEQRKVLKALEAHMKLMHPETLEKIVSDETIKGIKNDSRRSSQ